MQLFIMAVMFAAVLIISNLIWENSQEKIDTTFGLAIIICWSISIGMCVERLLK